jgi:hypothetical protein
LNGVNNNNNIKLDNNSIFSFLNKGTQASFKHLFAEIGHELSADFNYNESNNDNNSFINSSIINQRTSGSGNNKNYTSNIDYERLFKNNTKFEAGVRMNNRNEFNARDQYRNDILVNSISNQLKYSEQILAAYGEATVDEILKIREPILGPTPLRNKSNESMELDPDADLDHPTILRRQK